MSPPSPFPFGRAVAANVGVEMPRVAPAPKKKVTKTPSSPNASPDVTPPSVSPAPVVP